jgi:hypothetical protein
MAKKSAALLVVAAVVVFRLIGPLAGPEVARVLANVSPLAALIVAGAIYLPRPAAFAVPFGALFVSTVAVNLAKGWPLLDLYTLGTVVSFMVVFRLAWPVRGTRSAAAAFLTAIAGSVVFYLVSNSLAFAFEPGYPKSPAGWWQAQTVGLPLPGAPPSWWFLLKSLIGDSIFMAFMIAVCHPFAPAPASRAGRQAAASRA